MEHERVNDIRVRCRLNILRLYPVHRQANAPNLADFEAWKAENVAHMQNLIDSGTDEIDEGWPCPHEWQTVEASKKCNLEQAIEAARPLADYRFNVSVLQSERKIDEDLAQTDSRLSSEFDDLEARLERIDPEGLDRHSYLSGKLFTKVRA
jgi:hypothetical protein